MIYLTSTTNQQTIMIPNAYGCNPSGETMHLLILSTVDLTEFQDVFSSGGSFDASSFSEAFRIGQPESVELSENGRFVIVTMAFPHAPVVGSWEYRLLQGNQLVGGGCCQVGIYGEDQDIYEPPITRYDKTIQYEQYD